MKRTGEVGISVRGIRYKVGYWWRERGNPFNSFEGWWMSRRGPRYLSIGISLWRLALEFSAIERREA